MSKLLTLLIRVCYVLLTILMHSSKTWRGRLTPSGLTDDRVTTCIPSKSAPVAGLSRSSACSEEIIILTESDPPNLRRKNLSDEERGNIQCPDRKLSMPFIYLKNKHDRRYSKSWEDTFPWLSYISVWRWNLVCVMYCFPWSI